MTRTVDESHNIMSVGKAKIYALAFIQNAIHTLYNLPLNFGQYQKRNVINSNGLALHVNRACSFISMFEMVIQCEQVTNRRCPEASHYSHISKILL